MALASLPVKRDIFVGVFWPSLSFVKVWWGLDWIWDGVVERELVIVRSYLVFLLLGVGERHKVLGSKVHWFYHTLGLASLASPRLDPLQNILFGYLQHNLRNIQFLFARAPGILVGICLQICFGSTGARSFCTWDAREADCTFFCESYMLFICMYLLVRLSWFLQRFHCADRWEELRAPVVMMISNWTECEGEKMILCDYGFWSWFLEEKEKNDVYWIHALNIISFEQNLGY